MTDTSTAGFVSGVHGEAAPHAAGPTRQSARGLNRNTGSGRRALAIMAIGLGIPGAFVAVNGVSSDDPIPAIVATQPTALRAGLETALWATASAAFGHEGQPVHSVASTQLQPAKPPSRSAAAPCLPLTPVEETPLIQASHVPAADRLQSPPSIECLPPGLAAMPAVQAASLGAAQAAPKLATTPVVLPVVLKELPHAAPRPPQVAIAPLPTAPTAAATAAPRGLHIRPTIINKAAPLPAPDGMRAPGFVAQVAPVGGPPPLPEARPAPDVQMGVTSAGPAQAVPAPGALGVTAAGKGKTQTAQVSVGQWGNRPPEMLPWLEPDGSSRRSSLGGTNKGGSSGQIQVFGKTITTGAPKWTEDIYKSRN
jgi:hypothetical protein